MGLPKVGIVNIKQTFCYSCALLYCPFDWGSTKIEYFIQRGEIAYANDIFTGNSDTCGPHWVTVCSLRDVVQPTHSGTALRTGECRFMRSTFYWLILARDLLLVASSNVHCTTTLLGTCAAPYNGIAQIRNLRMGNCLRCTPARTWSSDIFFKCLKIKCVAYLVAV
jgi:hypothetical protein